MKTKFWITILIGFAAGSEAIDVYVPENCPPAQFAKQKIEAAAGGVSTFMVWMELDHSLGEQAYAIQTIGPVLRIRGDAAGLMYGGLDLAERMRFGEDLAALSVTNRPFIKRRGLKMNIPLDARCPSYDDSGTSARMNVEQVWSEDFWHAFLDRMAEYRYNTLTLWCNHPFSAMLKLKDYPDVALEDVAVPIDDPDSRRFQYMHRQRRDPQNYKIVKQMPIEAKIAFWRNVMRYARQRGIDLYFITWNIRMPGADGKYGITESQTNDATIAYLRESVKQFVLTYPDLKGMGVNFGEHMDPTLLGEYSVGNWMWNTYGQGIADAKAVDPIRNVHFICRTEDRWEHKMMDRFISKYPGPISLGYSYSKARLYSVQNPSFFNNELKSSCEEDNLSCWMNLRNEDIFNFRWGDPDYVRMYMLFLPHESLLAGYHMGSDGYVWGREFSSTEPDAPRQLEIDKHWYKFMLWGRLGYDPALKNGYFQKMLAVRFPDTNIPKLFFAWQAASKIVPLVNTWHWRERDHMWSVETCMSKKEGYHSVNHFIEFQPLVDQGMLSIDEFVRIPMAKGLTPIDVANNLDRLSLEVRASIQLLQAKKAHSKELRRTLADLEAFAFLGHYYADKIRGSTELHSFRINGLQHHQKRAENHLKAALVHWKSYGKVASRQYDTQLLARTVHTDWNGTLLEYAKRDVEIARTAEHNVFPPSVMNKNQQRKVD